MEYEIIIKKQAFKYIEKQPKPQAVRLRNAIREKDTKRVKKFIKKNWRLVVEKWNDVVIYKKRITVKRIQGIL